MMLGWGLLTIFAASASCQTLQLTVETTTGTITGLLNGTTPNVRQFLSIPFAKPPVDDLRWLPPQPLESNSSLQIDATRYPKSCPQYLSAVSSAWNTELVPWIPYRYDQPPNAGAALQTSGEDCLYLGIWTPTNATADSNLPVLFFITGGAFQTNGVDVPAQIPNHWVQRTQSHIVVTINYRMNIFGFPNAAGLDDQNLGILDQRAALEWVYENIAAFGGDPTRITMWGQSAGGISTDVHNFAYPEDPVVTSFFAQSGSVFLNIGTNDVEQSNFTFVAAQLGCEIDDDIERLDCMRNVSQVDISNFVGQYGDNSTLVDPKQPSLTFSLVADEKVVYSNYTAQYEKGAYANLPMIFSTTAMEGESLATFPENPEVEGPNKTEADATTINGFLCPAALSSMLRSKYNPDTPTYRNLFNGNFSNTSPLFWLGAYHASDLAMYFDTHQDVINPRTGARSTPQEYAVSHTMEDYLLDFVSTKGYPTGWPTYQQGQMLSFANGSQVEAVVPTELVDSVCN